VKAVAVYLGEGTDRYLASTFQALEKRPLSLGSLSGRAMIEAGEEAARHLVAGPSFYTQCPLTHSREHDVHRQDLADGPGVAQTHQPGRGQHNGFVLAFAQFAQTGIYIAPQIEYLEIWPD
jgi:hypothetical protein